MRSARPVRKRRPTRKMPIATQTINILIKFDFFKSELMVYLCHDDGDAMEGGRSSSRCWWRSSSVSSYRNDGLFLYVPGTHPDWRMSRGFLVIRTHYATINLVYQVFLFRKRGEWYDNTFYFCNIAGVIIIHWPRYWLINNSTKSIVNIKCRYQLEFSCWKMASYTSQGNFKLNLKWHMVYCKIEIGHERTGLEVN